MKKIPLESTLVGAYRFLFTNIISIIGTLWFPWLLLFAVAAGLVYLVVPHAWLLCDFKDIEHTNFVILMPAVGLSVFALIVMSIIVRAMVTVGLFRHALGEKKGITFIYFSLGSRVWRMVAVILIAAVTFVVLEVVAALAIGLTVAITSMLSQHVPPVVTGLINGVVGVIVIFLAIYTGLRLFFFLPAVVVAEDRIGLGRSWELGRGNFWRMIAVLLLIVIPVGFLADIALYLTVIPAIIAEAIKQHPQTSAEGLAFVKSLWPLLPMVFGIFLVMGIAMTGLMVGAVGAAYKSLTAEAPPAQDAPAHEPPPEDLPAETAASA